MAPNESRITAALVSMQQMTSGTILELDVLSSEPVPGYRDFGSKAVGQRITARLMHGAPDISTLIGKVIRARLRYEGDENSGMYLVSEVSAK